MSKNAMFRFERVIESLLHTLILEQCRYSVKLCNVRVFMINLHESRTNSKAYNILQLSIRLTEVQGVWKVIMSALGFRVKVIIYSSLNQSFHTHQSPGSSTPAGLISMKKNRRAPQTVKLLNRHQSGRVTKHIKPFRF